MTRVLTILSCAMLATAPLTAQDAGTVELGGFGRISWFDEATTLGDGGTFGAGGRLGFFFAENLFAEANASFTDTEGPGNADANYFPIHLRLGYAAGLNDDVFALFGAGAALNNYSGNPDGSDAGISGLLGLKAYFNDRTSLRTDLVLDFMPSPFNESPLVSNHTNLGLQLGVSHDLGTGRVGDTDGDGVRDDVDVCPTTPAGQDVLANGCPPDTDGDGVIDVMDNCEGTPAGVRVDARGCPVDSDRDGVADHLDQCRNTPRNTRVNETGCPVDTDGDGVPDARDQCADTPAGVAVTTTGCPRDTDGDGVADYQDRCPDSPRGAEVNTMGCPVDTDRDGVPNGLDRCPGTTAGTAVDANGCAELFTEESTTFVLEGVTFETNSADLTVAARQILDGVARSLNGNPDVRVEVAGHTDNTGARSYNLGLSQARADAVVEYLRTAGVQAGRMTARGYGPDSPIADNSTRDGRQQNRRVELRRVN